MWWSHHHPFKSGLTGETALQFCDAYTAATGKQWTQPIGFKHANLEVAIDALGAPKKLDARLDSRRHCPDRLQLDRRSHHPGKAGQTIPCGTRVRRRWSAGSGKRAQFKYDLNVVFNQTTPNIPLDKPFSAISLFLIRTAKYKSQASEEDRRTHVRRPPVKLFMTVLLQLSGVSKLYGALKAVDNVNVAVEDGEALAVIGPNGAGKTTLFNLITGDVAPTKGRIEFHGSDMTAMAPHARSRLGIGRSYQIPHPFANMSVFENLLVGAIFGGGVTERESYQRCSDVLKVTGACRKRPTWRRARSRCFSANAWSWRALRLAISRSSCCSTRSPAG